MYASRFVRIGLLVAAFIAAPALARAQDASAQALQQEVERLRGQVDALQSRLAALETKLGAAPQEAAAPAEPAPEPAAQAALPATPDVGAAASKVFNPDTSLIANFVGAAGKNPQSDLPSLNLSEVEAAFQAVVDPYARADFFLSAGPDGLEVEEGYVTFTSLPAGVLLKVGKMRAQFGKVNTMHTHVLPWADRPLVLQNLLGGDEGLTDAGLSVSKLIPNSFMFIDATGEVYHGDSEVFHTDQRSRLNYVGHLRGYRDLTEGTNLDLGVSYTHGPTADLFGGTPDLNRQITGIDATFRYRPLRRAIYKQFIGRTEVLWSKQDVPVGPQQHAFGFYGSADYQFAQRWFVGVRGDSSERAIDASLRDTGGSLALTFRPSEFSLIRGQYRRTRYAEDVTANEFLFQFNFAIGAHGAHPF